MSKLATKTYQELLQEFSQVPKDDIKFFTKKYEEVLEKFFELEQIYTIASKASSIEDVKNNRAKVFCALNHKKLPCMWLFSEKELAQSFVRHFNLIQDGVEYIRELKGEDIIKIIKQGIFNGVYQFSIDEGKCAMVVVTYDLLNAYLKSIGEEEFLLRSQYDLMILFNAMKFHKKTIFAIESDEKDDKETSLLAIDRKGVLNIFDTREDADVHKFDIGYGRKDSSELNIIQLRNAVNLAVDNNVEMIRFEIDGKLTEVQAKKVQYILNEMTFFVQ